MTACMITRIYRLRLDSSCRSCLKQVTLPVDQYLPPIISSHKSNLFVLSRCKHSNWAVEKKNQLKDSVNKQWEDFYTKYEEFVGLTDVQSAQRDVKRREKEGNLIRALNQRHLDPSLLASPSEKLPYHYLPSCGPITVFREEKKQHSLLSKYIKAEADFLEARSEERSVMRDVIEVRDQLKHVRERLSHVDYSNPLYPQLANEQHELVTKEEKMKNLLDAVEEKERDTFLVLSAAVRDSYEKERARVERTKNWSLIGSVVGTIIGMVGSSYINRLRTKDLKRMIEERNNNVEIQESIAQVLPHANEQYNDIKEEIKQLQVCLINKLLEPPKKPVGEEIISDPRIEDFNTALKSISSVLQNFQLQLANLTESSSQFEVNIAAQNDVLYEEMKNLPSVENYRLILDKLTNLKEQLEHFQKNIATGSPSSYTPITKSTKNEDEQAISTEVSDRDTIVEESKQKRPVRDLLIWSAVLSAVYYIFSF